MKKVGLFLFFGALFLVGFASATGSVSTGVYSFSGVNSLTPPVNSVNDLPMSCIAAKDECNNTCTRVNGTWACTLMACEVKQPVRCTQLAVDISVTIEPAVCTMEYMPVCAKVQVQCITAPCNPVWETFGNRCMAMNNPLVSQIRTGACEDMSGSVNGGMLVGGDRDSHGCIPSAGYTWDPETKQCVRPWEAEALLKLQMAHDFAYDNGITSMETVVDFRADDSISRQEASKMIVNFGKTILGTEVLNGMLNANASCTFTDSKWFGSTLSVYVTQSCQLGFMRGDMVNGKSVFYPQGNLTKAQALAILIRILDKRADETMNPWYQGYITKAAELGVDVSATTDRDTPITRGDLILWMKAFADTK